MNRTIGHVLAACLVTASTSAFAQTAPDPARLAEARAIVDIVSPPAEREQTMDKLMNQLTGPMLQNIKMDEITDPGLKALLRNFIAQTFDGQRPIFHRYMPQMFDAMAVAYTHEFSLAELKQVHAFALTPSGRHFLSKSAALAGDPAVVKVTTDMFAAAQDRMKPSVAAFKEELIAYVKAHPEAAEQLQKKAGSK